MQAVWPVKEDPELTQAGDWTVYSCL